jgi:bifunctional non-homologous end joining protein LigD
MPQTAQDGAGQQISDWAIKPLGRASAQRETLTIAGFALDGSKCDGLSGETQGRGFGFDMNSAKEPQAKLEPLIGKPSFAAKSSRIAAFG